MKSNLDFFKTLLKEPSPSGFEEKVINIFENQMANYGPITKGVYGNRSVTVGSNSPSIMLASHADEIGIMVEYINDEGFIYFSNIGGVDRYNLISQKVKISGQSGVVYGVIGNIPIHLQDDEKEVDTKALFIDIGAKSKEDAEKLLSVGDVGVVVSEPMELINNKFVGRGIDDKVGIWIVSSVIESLRAIQDEGHVIPLVRGVATIQEEIGGYGAVMAAKEYKPDISIAIDVTHATDLPNSEKEKNGDVSLGKGPVLFSGSCIYKDINKVLIDIAKEKDIPIQFATATNYSGTDADCIFYQHGGIKTSLISIPNRYMHSSVEMIDLLDVQNAVKLLTTFCIRGGK